MFQAVQRSFTRRVAGAYGVVLTLHLIGVALLSLGVLHDGVGWSIVGLALVAYLRGVVHSLDFDHIAMIDNSTRKFVAEGHRPASVGLAFSAGHSTIVVITGILVVSGVGWINAALQEGSTTAVVLGIIGVSVSGAYLTLVALANLVSFGNAWRLRQALHRDPGLRITAEDVALTGPGSRMLTAPLRRVTHPGHVYGLGMLFSLGFDTSSQIGLLILTAGAGLAGVPPLALLSFPILFAAAMTLGDTTNGLFMLRMYSAAVDHPARLVNYNLLITGIGIVAGLGVGILALASILDTLGPLPVISSLAAVDTSHAGFALVGLMLAIGLTLWLRLRFTPLRQQI